MANLYKPWRCWETKRQTAAMRFETCRLVVLRGFSHYQWALSAVCHRQKQVEGVCSPTPVIIVNGAAPGCTSMWQCRLEFQHSGIKALLESFSKTLHELSGAWRITHMSSQNESYFHLRRFLHGYVKKREGKEEEEGKNPIYLKCFYLSVKCGCAAGYQGVW